MHLTNLMWIFFPISIRLNINYSKAIDFPACICTRNSYFAWTNEQIFECMQIDFIVHQSSVQCSVFISIYHNGSHSNGILLKVWYPKNSFSKRSRLLAYLLCIAFFTHSPRRLIHYYFNRWNDNIQQLLQLATAIIWYELFLSKLSMLALVFSSKCRCRWLDIISTRCSAAVSFIVIEFRLHFHLNVFIDEKNQRWFYFCRQKMVKNFNSFSMRTQEPIWSSHFKSWQCIRYTYTHRTRTHRRAHTHTHAPHSHALCAMVVSFALLHPYAPCAHLAISCVFARRCNFFKCLVDGATLCLCVCVRAVWVRARACSMIFTQAIFVSRSIVAYTSICVRVWAWVCILGLLKW